MTLHHDYMMAGGTAARTRGYVYVSHLNRDLNIIFMVGDCLKIDSSCPAEYEPYLKNLIKITLITADADRQ